MSNFFPGIPKPISNESLVSWMQRVCQVYGLTFSRFHDTFETSPNIDPIPYLRLEWRFKHWRYCPIHRNPLSTKCPSCSKPLAMHRSILGGTVFPIAVANIAICLFCREDVRFPKYHRKDIIQDDADMAAIVAFQRTVISAVMHDYFFLQSSEEKLRLEELIRILERIGL